MLHNGYLLRMDILCYIRFVGKISKLDQVLLFGRIEVIMVTEKEGEKKKGRKRNRERKSE